MRSSAVRRPGKPGRPPTSATRGSSDITPDLVTAVWLGNDDYSRMNESYGGNIPARIWARFMKAALADAPKHDFAFPADEVAKLSGCGRGYEYYLKGTEPASPCGGTYAAYAAQNPVPYATLAPYATLPPYATEPPVAPESPAAQAPSPPADPWADPSTAPDANAQPASTAPPQTAMMDETEPACLVLTVGKFAARMVRWFGRDTQLKRIGIEGEVSGLREFGSGHLGFALKEKQAAVECVAWASDRRGFPVLENGAKAIAYGAVRVHPERSGYKLYVEAIEVAGLGELHLQYERLRQKFETEGLFEPSRKRAVPELPRRVALVSARGLGAEDFLAAIERTTPFVEVIFVETRVEGLGADVEIASALDEASRTEVNAIVLARGGGSEKDLFVFNLEPVVRAIVRAKRPVLTAIGHTSNHHLATKSPIWRSARHRWQPSTSQKAG